MIKLVQNILPICFKSFKKQYNILTTLSSARLTCYSLIKFGFSMHIYAISCHGAIGLNLRETEKRVHTISMYS